MFLIRFICWQRFFTLSVCNCFTVFIISGVFKTPKLKSPPESCFFIKGCTQMFMTRIYFYKVCLISESKNPEYLTPTIQTNMQLSKCFKVYEDYIKIGRGKCRKHKGRKTKNQFSKRIDRKCRFVKTK